MHDRRQYPRVTATFSVLVRLSDGSRVLRGQAADLSQSGIFVHLSDTIPEDQRVDVCIQDPARGDEIAIPGMVVHSVRNFGIGVRFETLSAKTNERLRSLLANLAAAAEAAAAQ